VTAVTKLLLSKEPSGGTLRIIYVANTVIPVAIFTCLVLYKLADINLIFDKQLKYFGRLKHTITDLITKVQLKDKEFKDTTLNYCMERIENTYTTKKDKLDFLNKLYMIYKNEMEDLLLNGQN